MGRVEVVERNFAKELSVAYEALERGVNECSTFFLNGERMTTILRIE